MSNWHLTEKQLIAIIDAKIKAHEIRVGFISGILGAMFFGAIIYAFTIVFSKLEP